MDCLNKSKTKQRNSIMSIFTKPVNILETFDYASNLFKERNLKYDCHEYSKHLIDVFNIGVEYLDLLADVEIDLPFGGAGRIPELRNGVLNALICHDTLEDCGVSYNDLKKKIGEFAADIVYDVSNELGKNRKERAERTYPKTKKNNYAIFVKCCDRLANAKFSEIENPNPMFQKYVKEYSNFRKELNNGYFQELWKELDERLRYFPGGE